jgi:hypothetical protein
MSTKPAKYGGLKVSYIRLSMDATAFKVFGMKVNSKPATAVQPPHLRHNSRVGVQSKQGKSRKSTTGRAGLLLAQGFKHYLTMPTHIITQELHASRSSRGLFGWPRNTDTPYLSANWEADVEPSAGGEKVPCILYITSFGQQLIAADWSIRENV